MVAQAILFGLALGDALGWPVEFMKLDDIKDIRGIKTTYGPQGILEPPDPAQFTDDTQMTIALTRGLLDVGLDADVDRQMTAVANRFVAWSISSDNNRAPGNACMAGIRRYQSGSPWYEAGLLTSKGCGSAMRVATIGYLYQRDPSRLVDVARASSLITHRHPTAIAASIAAAYLIKLALDNVSPEQFPARILAVTDGISEEFDRAILRIGHVMSFGSEERALKHLGNGWTGEEAVALALYCILKYPNDYVACVCRAANTDGDSDSIACIAGGVMGARLGLSAIPDNWRARCERREELILLAEQMVRARVLFEAGRIE